jgi:hypothetical protein
MSTKTNIAAIAAFLTILAAPGFASAQEGFGNYASSQALPNTYPVPENRLYRDVDQSNAKALLGAHASTTPAAVKRARTGIAPQAGR